MNADKVFLIIISGLGVFHGLFFSILLWFSKASNRVSNQILSFLLIVLSIRIGKSVLMAFTGDLATLYIYVGLCLMMFIGPLFYLYSRSLEGKILKLEAASLLHFVPGILFMLLSIPMEKIGFRNVPVFIAGGLYAAIYFHCLSYLLFVKFRILERRTVSLSKSDKGWLNVLFVGLSAVWFEYVLNLFEEDVPYIMGPVIYSITVYLITYLAFTKKYLNTDFNIKYQSSPYSAEEVDSLFQRIQVLMEEEKLFLDPNISLAGIAKKLMASPQKISLVVNSRAGCNFNEYINRFRIQHTIDLLNKPGSQSLTIASISFDSGFNSLSSFNVAFKKIIGITPSAYRNSLE